MEVNLNESKELLLLEIESTAMWRSQKANEYPHDEMRNRNAYESLMQLHDFVEKLPNNHPLFQWYNSANSEREVEWINSEIRAFGFQNIVESPTEYIKSLVKEGIRRGFIERLDDNLN